RAGLGHWLYHARADHCPCQHAAARVEPVESAAAINSDFGCEMTTSRSPSHFIGNLLYWVALGAAFVFFLFPLVWMLITSIKERADVTTLPATFVPWAQFEP